MANNPGVSVITVPGTVPEGEIVVTVIGPVKIDVPVYKRVVVTAPAGGVSTMTVPGTEPDGGMVVTVVGPLSIDVPVYWRVLLTMPCGSTIMTVLAWPGLPWFCGLVEAWPVPP